MAKVTNYKLRNTSESGGRTGHICTGCKTNFAFGETFEIANVRLSGYRISVVNAHNNDQCREAAVRNVTK